MRKKKRMRRNNLFKKKKLILISNLFKMKNKNINKKNKISKMNKNFQIIKEKFLILMGNKKRLYNYLKIRDNN